MKPDTLLDCQICGKNNPKIYLPARLEGLKKMSPDFFSPYNSIEGHFQINECRNCCLLYSSPIANFTEEHYPEAPYDALKEVVFWKRKTFNRELKFIERYLKKGKLLEVGAGLGAFLEAARERGWDAEGVEPNKQATEYCLAKGLRVKEGYFNAEDYPSAHYDCIVFSGVLDHLLYPRKVIRSCLELLKEGGGIWATVTNGKSLFAKILKSRFPGFQYQHLYYFSKKTLRCFFESLGCSVPHVAANWVSYPLTYYLKAVEKRLPSPMHHISEMALTRHIPLTLPTWNLEALALKIEK